MTFMRNHWPHVGVGIFTVLAIWLIAFQPQLPTVQFLLVLNLMALFAHQFEEYVFPGGAPSLINRVVYDETERADRYPGNTLSIMLVNTIAWVIYAVAIFLPDVHWLGMGVIFFSLFQLLGHVLEQNIKLRTWYNPGMATTVLLFTPLGAYFIWFAVTNGLMTSMDWVLAVVTLVACIAISIVLPVQALKNEKTSYIINDWQMKRAAQITEKCRIK